MLLEAVPGATVLNFAQDERGVSFQVEAEEDVQLTLELEADTEYKILVDDVNVGKMKTNMTGKVTFSVEIQKNATPVKIEKIGLNLIFQYMMKRKSIESCKRLYRFLFICLFL